MKDDCKKDEETTILMRKKTKMWARIRKMTRTRMMKGMLRKKTKTKMMLMRMKTRMWTRTKMMTRTKCKWASRTVGRENNHFAEKGEKLTGRGLV